MQTINLSKTKEPITLNKSPVLTASKNYPDYATSYPIRVRISIENIDENSVTEKIFPNNSVACSARVHYAQEDKQRWEDYIQPVLCNSFNMQNEKAQNFFGKNNEYYAKLFKNNNNSVSVKYITNKRKIIINFNSQEERSDENLVEFLNFVAAYNEKDGIITIYCDIDEKTNEDYDHYLTKIQTNTLISIDETYIQCVVKDVPEKAEKNVQTLSELKELIGGNLRNAVGDFTVACTVNTKTSPDVLKFSLILNELLLDEPTDQVRHVTRQVINLDHIEDMHEYIKHHFCFGVPTSMGAETVNQPYLIMGYRSNLTANRESVDFLITEIIIEPHLWAKTGIFPKTDKYPSQNPNAKYHYKSFFCLNDENKITHFLQALDNITNDLIVNSINKNKSKKIKNKFQDGMTLNWDDAATYFVSKGVQNAILNTNVIKATPPDIDDPEDEDEIHIRLNGKGSLESFYERSDIQNILESLSCQSSLNEDKIVLKFTSEQDKLDNLCHLKKLINIERRVRYTGMYDDDEFVKQWTPQIQINKHTQYKKENEVTSEENKHKISVYDKLTKEIIDIVEESELLPMFQYWKYNEHSIKFENVVFRITKIYNAMKREFGYRVIIVSIEIDRSTLKKFNDTPSYESIDTYEEV